MVIADALEIVSLKAKARRLYLQIHHRSDMSCGAHLAEFIRPDIVRAKQEFNETMARLAELDPEAKALLEKCGQLA